MQSSSAVQSSCTAAVLSIHSVHRMCVLWNSSFMRFMHLVSCISTDSVLILVRHCSIVWIVPLHHIWWSSSVIMKLPHLLPVLMMTMCLWCAVSWAQVNTNNNLPCEHKCCRFIRLVVLMSENAYALPACLSAACSEGLYVAKEYIFSEWDVADWAFVLQSSY